MRKHFRNLALTGLLIGSMVIGGVSSMALANGSAYQNYKNAAMQTIKEQNMTVNADLTVRQDGQIILTGNTLLQMNGDSLYSNSRMQANGEVTDIETSVAQGTAIVRAGGQYSLVNFSSKEENELMNLSPNSMKLMEMVADLLVGDVKTHFTGDSNTVSVSLEGAQIPELLNVAAAAMAEHSTDLSNRANKVSDNTHELFGNTLKDLPIMENVQIKSIRLNAILQNGYLKSNDATIILSGTDNSGTIHELEINGSNTISDIGSTTPDTIDTTGISLENIFRR